VADLKLDIDITAIEKTVLDFKAFDAELNKAVQTLAAQTHTRILENVQQRLHARRKMYVEALRVPKEVAPGVFVIVLDEKAVWIEEGMPPHDMVDDLLRKATPGAKPPRQAKDGSLYRIIPFKQNEAPSGQTPGEKLLTDTVKAELKKLRIEWNKVERDPQGKPLSGRLHSAVLKDHPAFEANPQRPDGTAGKPGWGKGDEGQVMQGPVKPGQEKNSGIPMLRGLAIYQTPLFKKDKEGNQVPDLDKKGLQRARRDILTFRIVSSKHKGQKWQHPGIEGTRFFDDAFQWCQQEWDQNIMPALTKKYANTL
jgi:hypothetical protein